MIQLTQLQNMDFRLNGALAKFEQCNPGAVAPKPKIAARQGLSSLGGIGDIIPGYNAYVGANHAVGDVFTRLSEWINPIPRNCNETLRCFSDTRKISLIVEQQAANVTRLENEVAGLAAKNSQCVEHQVDIYEQGLQGRNVQLQARSHEGETKAELYELLQLCLGALLTGLRDHLLGLCEAIRSAAFFHENEEQNKYQHFEGEVAAGFTGNLPPHAKPCIPAPPKFVKRSDMKVNPEDLDDKSNVIEACKADIQNYMLHAKKYNMDTQKLKLDMMDPKMNLWHPQEYYPKFNDTPICEAVSPTATRLANPLPSHNPVQGLPPLPTGTFIPENPITHQIPGGSPDRSKPLVKRDDELHEAALKHLRNFNEYLHSMTIGLIGEVAQCRTDKETLMDAYWDEHYESRNEAVLDTFAAASSLSAASALAKTVVSTVTSTVTAEASSATITSTIIRTVTEAASSIGGPSSSSSAAAVSSPQKMFASSIIQAPITVTAARLSAEESATIHEPATVTVTAALSSAQKSAVADEPATVTVPAAVVSSSAQSSSTSSAPVEPSVVTIPASVVTLSPSLKTVEPSTLPQSSTTSVARLTVTV